MATSFESPVIRAWKSKGIFWLHVQLPSYSQQTRRVNFETIHFTRRTKRNALRSGLRRKKSHFM